MARPLVANVVGLEGTKIGWQLVQFAIQNNTFFVLSESSNGNDVWQSPMSWFLHHWCQIGFHDSLWDFSSEYFA